MNEKVFEMIEKINAKGQRIELEKLQKFYNKKIEFVSKVAKIYELMPRIAEVLGVATALVNNHIDISDFRDDTHEKTLVIGISDKELDLSISNGESNCLSVLSNGLCYLYDCNGRTMIAVDKICIHHIKQSDLETYCDLATEFVKQFSNLEQHLYEFVKKQLAE